MSGHSKWAQIKRQKGAKDIKRGLTFTKLSNAINIAVKHGGGIGDPDQNFRLRLAVDAAKMANMPKENIERAIERSLGKQGATLEETVYEGFGPKGVSIIVEAATDNKNRTTSEVKNIFEKNGGTMGQPGSVAYQFKQIGRLILAKNGMFLDDIFLIAADAGAEDVQEEEEQVAIYTSPNELNTVRQALIKQGLNINDAGLIRVPIIPIDINDNESISKIVELIDKLEELDDVQSVYSNLKAN